MPERRMKHVTVYEVLQDDTVVCSWEMALKKREAENKLENEKRRGGTSKWTIRPVRIQMEQL